MTNIPTNDITELNDLIHVGDKLVFEKIEVPLKATSRKSKPGWELRLESLMKRHRQQASKQKQNIKNVLDETEKCTTTRTQKNLEETNQKKLLAKEEKLKRYRKITVFLFASLGMGFNS